MRRKFLSRPSASFVVGFVGLFTGLLTIAGPVPAASAQTQNMAVPAYFSPGPFSTQMDHRAVPTLQLAVMNPASGPGSAPDPRYVSAARAAQSAGITVVGYVDTSHAGRSLSAVESDVNAYYRWYGVNGIFFDEASTNCADAGLLRDAQFLREGRGRHRTDNSQPGKANQ